MWVINAERNVCWTTGNFLFRKRSWELPVEECIVGLLAAGPWPQLQLTKGKGGRERKKKRHLPTDVLIHVARIESRLIQVQNVPSELNVEYIAVPRSVFFIATHLSQYPRCFLKVPTSKHCQRAKQNKAKHKNKQTKISKHCHVFCVSPGKPHGCCCLGLRVGDLFSMEERREPLALWHPFIWLWKCWGNVTNNKENLDFEIQLISIIKTNGRTLYPFPTTPFWNEVWVSASYSSHWAPNFPALRGLHGRAGSLSTGKFLWSYSREVRWWDLEFQNQNWWRGSS